VKFALAELYKRPTNIDDAMELGFDRHEAAIADILTRNLCVHKDYQNMMPSEILKMVSENPNTVGYSSTQNKSHPVCRRDFNNLPAKQSKVGKYIRQMSVSLEKQLDFGLILSCHSHEQMELEL